MANGIVEVQAPSSTGTIGRLGPRVAEAPAAEQTEPITDRVEISATATWLGKYHALPDIRADLVARIRDQIKAGTYETPQKWDQAIANLMDDLQT